MQQKWLFHTKILIRQQQQFYKYNILVAKMDFEALATIIPKPTQLWTVDDTQKWIKFTGLEVLADGFQNFKIDGSCLHTLTQQDFINELGVSSKIMLKKIMTWINKGLASYDQYLRQNRLGSTMKPLQKSMRMQPTEMQNSYKKIQEPPQKIEQRQATYSGNRISQQNQLIIRQSETNQTNCYAFKNKGGTIGRSNTNDICVSDDFVSRFHAEILFEQEEFYIRDCGSNSGTYLRITQKKQLYNGIVLEMGSNQFEVDLSDSQMMGLMVIDGPNTDLCVRIPKKDKVTIGRKSHNEVNFEDHHLSNIHSTFFNVNGIWYVQDLGSTNGTWIRLSNPGIKSSKWKLEDKAQFKISTNFTYECRRNTQNRKTEKQRGTEKCILCKTQDRNAIILPCKHNTCCHDCIIQRQMENCQSCGATIKDVVKIFRA